jgi:HK97 family phage major capsid protein
MKISDLLKTELFNLEKDMDALMNKEGVTADEINAKANEMKTIQAKLDYALQKEEKEETEAKNKIANKKMKPVEAADNNAPEDKQSVGEIMAKAIIGMATPEELGQIKNLMQEGVGENGGLTVPKDVKTKIIELQRKYFDVRNYICVEPTNVNKGSRVKEKNEPQASGFASVDERADIQKLHEPELEEVEYAIRKYAGFIPITKELLEDSAENILSYILRWMAKNELNTYAYQVFNGTGSKSAEGIMTDVKKTNGKLKNRVDKLDKAPTIKQFKTVFNVDLDEIDDDSAYIYTNSLGWDYLDGLEDKQGKPYLQPDITKATGYKFLNKTVVKVPSRFLATYDDGGTNRTPFICGDLELLYTMYDRKRMSIESTKIGGEAWRSDKTEVKGSFRFDGKINGDVKAVKILLAKLD